MGLKMKLIQMNSKITDLFKAMWISYSNSILAHPNLHCQEKNHLSTMNAKEGENVAKWKSGLQFSCDTEGS